MLIHIGQSVLRLIQTLHVMLVNNCDLRKTN